MVGPAERLEDLHGQTEQNRLNFLRTDVELCFTLGGIVETVVLGNLIGARGCRMPGFRSSTRRPRGTEEAVIRTQFEERLSVWVLIDRR
jgi:hypothetical protein